MSAAELETRNGLYGFDQREPDERRVPAEERKTWNIKAFWQRHHEIVNLAAQGYKQVEIAKILNIDPQTVSNTLNSTLGEEKLANLREIRDGETKVRLEQVRILTDKAIQVYHEIFDNERGEATLKDRKEAANAVLLELSGLRVPTRIQSQSNVTVLTATELAEFKARGIAALRESGLVAESKEESRIVNVEAEAHEPGDSE